MNSTNKTLIYLIGMMGTGKTTTAPIIAEKLGYSFADTDSEVEKARNQSSYEIVDEIGVNGFRKLETEALAKVAEYTQVVVACGGGIVLREENYPYLRQDNAVVLWLKLPVEEIHKRIESEPRANLRGLSSQELMTKLETIYAQRHDLYEKLSDICILIDPQETSQQLASKGAGK